MSKISILATTDVHGYIDQGLGHLHTLSADLLIDNGDFLIGSPLATYGYSECVISPMVGIANDLGYDVMVPGNHDLDFGLDWLKTQVEALDTDYVCANLLNNDGSNVFPSYVIKEVNGVRVAIIGLLTGAFSQLATHSSVLNVIVESPIKVLKRLITQINQESDLIVVAYHGGLTNDPASGAVWTYPSTEDQAYQIMTAFPEINSVICGHQHFVNSAVHSNDIALVQPGTQAKVAGYQEFDWDSKGLITIVDNKIITLDAVEYNLACRGSFEEWLNSPVDLAKVAEFITERYPADFHFLDYTAITLDDLVGDTQGPFPLSRYYLSGHELAEFMDLEGLLDESRNYNVIATPGILPDYRIREQYLIPLFDEIVKHKSY